MRRVLAPLSSWPPDHCFKKLSTPSDMRNGVDTQKYFIFPLALCNLWAEMGGILKIGMKPYVLKIEGFNTIKKSGKGRYFQKLS